VVRQKLRREVNKIKTTTTTIRFKTPSKRRESHAENFFRSLGLPRRKKKFNLKKK